MVTDLQKNQAEEEQEETPDTADPQAVNKARKREARTRADRLKFIQAAMSMKEGRAWFYDLLLFCKVLMPAVNEDPYKTYFNLGQQNIGLRILDDIQTVSADQYTLMVKENKRMDNIQ